MQVHFITTSVTSIQSIIQVIHSIIQLINHTASIDDNYNRFNALQYMYQKDNACLDSIF